jgi:hypothetical protein
MRFDFYGLTFDAPRITFFMWSPWRASALEHRLFDVLRELPRVELEETPEELRLHLTDSKTYRSALQAIARVLKGWQEEADPGSEQRRWRWLLEGDTDDAGYDHTGEPTCMWAFIRVSLERGGPGEPDKGEDVDLDGFGMQVPSSNGPA